MSEVKVNKVSPRTGTDVTLGDSGDTFTVPSGATLTTTSATVNLPATTTVTTELKTNKISPASGTAFTLGDSGDTFTIPSGATITNSGTATGFGGITEADAFRLTTAVNGSGLNFITSNIERIDETSFSKIGTGLTESSGVFSFASTGIYLVQASFNWYSNNNNYTRGYIYVTTDNASYDSVAQSTEYIQAGELSNGYTFAFVDVTDVSQVKVKFAFMGGDASSGVLGDTAETETGFNFIRLGDT